MSYHYSWKWKWRTLIRSVGLGLMAIVILVSLNHLLWSRLDSIYLLSSSSSSSSSSTLTSTSAPSMSSLPSPSLPTTSPLNAQLKNQDAVDNESIDQAMLLTIPVQDVTTINNVDDKTLTDSVASIKFNARPKVYTYFEDIPTLEPSTHEEMLLVWQRNWWAGGFHPIVLSPIHATRHPDYQQLVEKFKKYPSINDPAYELACYRRWLALAVVGGGFFLDYDMMLVGGSREKLMRDFFLDNSIQKDDLLTDPSLMPMVTIAGSEGLQRLIDTLANYKGEVTKIKGQPHLSDMIILGENRFIYKSLPQCPLPIAHFSNYQFGQFLDSFEFRANRARWATEILQLYGLGRRKTFLALPQGTVLTRELPMPRHVEDMLTKCLKTMDQAFFNLIPYREEGFFPGGPQPTLHVVTEELPDEFRDWKKAFEEANSKRNEGEIKSQDENNSSNDLGEEKPNPLLLVGFWPNVPNHFTTSVEAFIKAHNDYIVALPLGEDDGRMKIVLEFTLGTRFQHWPTFKRLGILRKRMSNKEQSRMRDSNSRDSNQRDDLWLTHLLEDRLDQFLGELKEHGLI